MTQPVKKSRIGPYERDLLKRARRICGALAENAASGSLKGLPGSLRLGDCAANMRLAIDLLIVADQEEGGAS